MKRSKETREKYLEANQKKIAKQKKDYYESNKDKMKEDAKAWRKANKDKVDTYRRNKMKVDVMYKLKTNIKTLIGHSFRFNRIKKSSRTEQILGCSYLEFKQYMESKFEPWMSWENRGLYNGELNHGWDIDHIIPISTAKNEYDVIRLNHYTNLQPLCSYINRYVKRNNV